MKKLSSSSSSRLSLISLTIGVGGYIALRSTNYDFIFIAIIVISLIVSNVSKKKNSPINKNIN